MTNPAKAASEFARYLRTETVGGLVLLGATTIALLWANSPLAGSYTALRDFQFGPHLFHLHMPTEEWAKSGLLTLFFYVAGLELKRELVSGELSDRKAAALPVIAAIGGIVVPAVIALSIAGPGTAAWSVPVATDIAFALGVLAITGSGMPDSARIFLLSLAVVDDLGAIALIAILFTNTFNLLALGAAVALLALYWFLQHRRVTSPLLYVPIAVAVWIAVHSSGLHATIAGVALGLLTRVRRDPYEKESPALRMEHLLQPWSAGLAVPVFALFAAGIRINSDSFGALFTDRLALAIMIGLVLGKLIGIVGSSWLAVRLKIAVRPEGMAWRDVIAVAMLGGVGFTVSLLIAELALTGSQVEVAKMAVLVASAVASLLAAAALLRRSQVHQATD
ncbi:Na+/H+ antiporter NhaA [Pseudonocardiaceae bacterium YIM PH 21723]|nr:Na+/H+ antiporter NhaA [Pseudonocardiaceae bacterium YIM PH 21723]